MIKKGILKKIAGLKDCFHINEVFQKYPYEFDVFGFNGHLFSSRAKRLFEIGITKFLFSFFKYFKNYNGKFSFKINILTD